MPWGHVNVGVEEGGTATMAKRSGGVDDLSSGLSAKPGNEQ